MSGISVIVITRNESANIEECLRSASSFSSDIVVVDAESSDDTAAKARNLGARVIVKPWEGYAAAKQFALEQTKHDWVLWLDADERVMPELAREIPAVIAAAPVHAAFTVARRAYFLGRWIRHSGWYPGRVARLFHKQHARFNNAAVHEGLEIDGSVGTLQHDLLHYTDPNLYHYLSKFNRYTTLATEGLVQNGKRSSFADLLIRPWWLFVRMYILRRGFLDGVQGLLLALFSSAYVFTKYAKLRERTVRREHE